MPAPFPSDRFEFRNAPNGPPGYQMFTVDWARGFMRGVGEGFWSMEQTTAHFARWCECVRTIQRSGLRVRILADLRTSQTQSQEVADFLGKALAGLYRPDDRIALVVPSSLVKMQMRRVLPGGNYEFFISETAAEHWLDAFDPTLDMGTRLARAVAR